MGQDPRLLWMSYEVNLGDVGTAAERRSGGYGMDPAPANHEDPAESSESQHG
jgi:hypothetical protein